MSAGPLIAAAVCYVVAVICLWIWAPWWIALIMSLPLLVFGGLVLLATYMGTE